MGMHFHHDLDVVLQIVIVNSIVANATDMEEVSYVIVIRKITRYHIWYMLEIDFFSCM